MAVGALNFGDPFFYDGLLYVKSRPALVGRERYNCVGVGHEGRIYLWKEVVQPASIIARIKPCYSIERRDISIR